MEILLQSHKIKNGARDWLQEKFLNITGKQKNIIIEHVSEIEIKGQKSNEQQKYKLDLNDLIGKTRGQQGNKNACPRTMRDKRSLTKSQSMPDLFR